MKKITTGITFIDNNWGGFYPGGNYLFYGPKRTGKRLIGLKIVQHFFLSAQNILLITTERNKSLQIQAESINFDIEKAIDKKLLLIKRFQENSVDKNIIKNLVKEFSPKLIIFDEITELISFNNLKSFISEYDSLMEVLEENNILSLFITSLPKSNNSKLIIQQVIKNSVGIIQLKPNLIDKKYSGTISLKPLIGHIEGEFNSEYKIEPQKGLVFQKDLDAFLNEKSVEKLNMKETKKSNDFSEINYSNIYNFDEFRILLDLKSASVESSGKKFSLVIYEINTDRINPEELCKLISQIVDIGDKLTCFGNKIYILFSERKQFEIKNLLDEIEKSIFEEYKFIQNLNEYIIRTHNFLTPNFVIE